MIYNGETVQRLAEYVDANMGDLDLGDPPPFEVVQEWIKGLILDLIAVDEGKL